MRARLKGLRERLPQRCFGKIGVAGNPCVVRTCLSILFVAFSCTLFLDWAPAAENFAIAEASGVVRSGDHLLIVDDGQRGVYFRLPLQGRKGPVIPVDRGAVERMPLPFGNLVTDTESIEILGDGRVVVLSERLRALFGPDGVVASYDAPLAEFGKRGLEGLAVRAMPDGGSRVAVLWEGGYPEYQHVPPQLQPKVGRLALRPMVLLHTLNPGDVNILVRSPTFIVLQAPVPKGRAPRAQRFRAPDLVWHREADGAWGFITLLSSHNSKGERKYQYHWLQRFSRDGKPIGSPLDLDLLAPPDLKATNWEGLAWFEKNESLVLVNESHPEPAGVAFVVQLPEAWKFQEPALSRFTHRLRDDTRYYLDGPGESKRPDGELLAGTRVTMIEVDGRFCLIRTDSGVVAHVSRASLTPYKAD